MDIDRIMDVVREVAPAGSKVSISIRPPRKPKPNWEMRIIGPDKRDRVVSLLTPDKKRAKAIEAEVRTRFDRLAIEGIVPKATSDYISEWLEMKEKELRIRSYCKYRQVLEKVKPFLAAEVHRITRQHIERYRDWLVREEYKPKSINEELTILRQLFDKAKLLGYAKENPVEHVKRMKVPPSDVEPYTDEEIDAIFEELDRRVREGSIKRCREAWGVYMEIFFALFYTGLRVSDAIMLSWENVGDLKFATINIPHQVKTHKPVQIRIPTDYVERLRALQQKHRLDGRGTLKGPIYTNTKGSSVEYQHLDSAIRIVLKAIGLKKKSPIHSFRHTVARRLLDAGMPVHEVANQLGDTVETIVRNYVKPAVPTRAAVDAAFGVGSRTGHVNMDEMAGLAVVHGIQEIPHTS